MQTKTIALLEGRGMGQGGGGNGPGRRGKRTKEEGETRYKKTQNRLRDGRKSSL